MVCRHKYCSQCQCQSYSISEVYSKNKRKMSYIVIVITILFLNPSSQFQLGCVREGSFLQVPSRIPARDRPQEFRFHGFNEHVLEKSL